MARNQYPLVHVYPQPSSRHPVRIVGNTVGLLTLVTAIIEATSIAGKGSNEAFCNNAESFEIQVIRDDSDSAWKVLELPCSG